MSLLSELGYFVENYLVYVDAKKTVRRFEESAEQFREGYNQGFIDTSDIHLVRAHTLARFEISVYEERANDFKQRLNQKIKGVSDGFHKSMDVVASGLGFHRQGFRFL